MHHTPSTRPVRFQRPLSKRGGEMQPCSAGFEGHVFSVCSDPFQLSRLFPSAPRRFFYSQEITSRRVLFTRYMVENVQFNIQDDLTIHPFPRFILIRIKRRHRSTTGAAFLRAMCLSLLSRLAAKNQDNWRRMKNNTVHRGWRWVVGLNKILFSPASSTITSFTLSVQPIRLRLHLLKPIVFSCLLLSVVTQAHIFATCPSPHSPPAPTPLHIHPFASIHSPPPLWGLHPSGTLHHAQLHRPSKYRQCHDGVQCRGFMSINACIPISSLPWLKRCHTHNVI